MPNVVMNAVEIVYNDGTYQVFRFESEQVAIAFGQLAKLAKYIEYVKVNNKELSILTILAVICLVGILHAQQFKLKNKYGQNQRIEKRGNRYNTYNRKGIYSGAFKVQGNKIYQYDKYGRRN